MRGWNEAPATEWSAVPCTEMHAVVCETPHSPPPSPPMLPPTPSIQNLVLLPLVLDVGDRTETSFYGAAALCARFNGDVVTTNSQEQNERVKAMIGDQQGWISYIAVPAWKTSGTLWETKLLGRGEDSG
eukprot:3678110-Prymnesium_polylepis.1